MPVLWSNPLTTPPVCLVCGGAMRWLDCPAGGWWAHDRHPADGHDAVSGPQVLVAVICCPACKTELEGTWAEPADPDDDVEPALQTCGECAETWTAEWPGFSFRTEAG